MIREGDVQIKCCFGDRNARCTVNNIKLGMPKNQRVILEVAIRFREVSPRLRLSTMNRFIYVFNYRSKNQRVFYKFKKEILFRDTRRPAAKR